MLAMMMSVMTTLELLTFGNDDAGGNYFDNDDVGADAVGESAVGDDAISDNDVAMMMFCNVDVGIVDV